MTNWFLHKRQLLILVIAAIFASHASASPRADAVRTYAGPNETLWNLMPDDTDPSLFYRLPDYFAIAKRPTGQNEVAKRYQPNGDLVLNVSWKARDWIGEEPALRAAIMAETGISPRFISLFPRVKEILTDPQLTEDFGAKIENSFDSPDLVGGGTWVSQIIIPQKYVKPFIHRVVEGSGFTHLIRMELRLPDGKFGDPITNYPYSVGMLFGSLRYCDVVPKLWCEPNHYEWDPL